MKRCIFLIFFILSVLGVCYYYLCRIVREDIEQTELILEVSGWQGRALRLVVLSDLHARPCDGAYMDRIVSETMALNPDAVLLLGDYVNGHQSTSMMSTEILAKHLRPLSQVPCYAVLGNHDHAQGTQKITTMLQSLGFHIVEGKRVPLVTADSVLDIGGIQCLYTHREPGIVPQPRETVPMILLSHSPVGAEFAPRSALLTISGHTHGGQVCWPSGKAIESSLSRMRPGYLADGRTPLRLASGLVDVEGNPCYVTRGLGTSILPIRIFCRPELLLLIVKAPGK